MSDAPADFSGAVLPSAPRSLIALFVDPTAYIVRETQLPLDADGSGPDLAEIKKRLGDPDAALGWATLTYEQLAPSQPLRIEFSPSEAKEAVRAVSRYAIAFCLDDAEGAMCQPNLPHSTNGAFCGPAFIVFFEDLSDGDSRPLPPLCAPADFARRCSFPDARQRPLSMIPLPDPFAPKPPEAIDPIVFLAPPEPAPASSLDFLDEDGEWEKD